MQTAFQSKRSLATIFAALGLFTTSQGYAANAVVIQNWDGGDNVLEAGSNISVASAAGNNSSYTDNPALNYSSWAHTGNWWQFELVDQATTTLRVETQNGFNFIPGISLWTSGNTAFDGGTTGFGGEVSSASIGTPHSFNSTGAIGDTGTLWMANGSGGNMLETLAYGVANTVNYHAGVTGWGEHIHHGVHDVSVSNLFESGISGSTGVDYVELVLTDLQPGWYTFFIGGTDHASAGGLYDVSVSANPVPAPAAAYLLGSALLGLIGRSYRQS